MTNKSITCEHCAALNPAEGSLCIACGAPLPRLVTSPMKVTVVDEHAAIPEPVTPSIENQPLSQQLKEGAAVVGSSLGALGIGSLLLRTGAEALAIAFSAFLVGFLSAQTRSLLIGLAGGALIGLAVGSVTKRSFIVLLTAPVGTLLGMGASYLLRRAIPGLLPLIPWTAILAAAGGAVLGSVGGYRARGGIMSWYQRLRPYLGIAGGVLFALFGFALGKLF